MFVANTLPKNPPAQPMWKTESRKPQLGMLTGPPPPARLVASRRRFEVEYSLYGPTRGLPASSWLTRKYAAPAYPRFALRSMYLPAAASWAMKFVSSTVAPEYASAPRTIGVISRSDSRAERIEPILAGSCEWKIASYRVMPASTSVSKTMSAWAVPLCGRAAGALSIRTFNARRAALGWPGAFCRPLSGQQVAQAGREDGGGIVPSGLRTVTTQKTPMSSIHWAPSTTGRRPRTYTPGVIGAFTANWNHATWPGPT